MPASDYGVNGFGEPILLDTAFAHPCVGKFKDQPEEFFRGKAVRILVDVDVDGKMYQFPTWLDVVGFRDVVVSGAPVRLGVGVTQQRLVADSPIAGGVEMEFSVEEVFDVLDAHLPQQDGGIYLPLASAAS